MSVVGKLRIMGADTYRGVLRLVGDSYKPGGAAGTTVRVLLVDQANKVLLATGTTMPPDGQAGFAKGCLFIDTDVAAGTSGLFVNVGTITACNFDQVTDL